MEKCRELGCCTYKAAAIREPYAPAAAVIPIAYIKVVVVKKLVVGSRQVEGGMLASRAE